MSDSDPHRYTDRYMLRLPDGLRDRIKTAASTSGRSMNSEIVETLNRAYPSLTGIEATVARLQRLIEVARSLGHEHQLGDIALDLEVAIKAAAAERAAQAKSVKSDLDPEQTRILLAMLKVLEEDTTDKDDA